MSRRISGLGALLGLLLLASACQAYFASPPAGQEVPTAVVSPPAGQTSPTEVSSGWTPPVETPKPPAYPPPAGWTPPPTDTPVPTKTPEPWTPSPTPTPWVVIPTPYAPAEALPEGFPTVVYAVQRPEQAVQLWTLRYEHGMLREELLLDLTEEVLEPRIGFGHSYIGSCWVSSLSSSPDGMHVALVLRTTEGGGIFTLIVGTDGQVYLPLQPNGQGIGFLDWFADGKKILLGGASSFRGGVSALDGTGFLPLPAMYDAVVVSQDAKIIFSTGKRLNAINTDGSALASLSLPFQESEGWGLFNLTLSSSGQLIAFTWARTPQPSDWGAGQIWVMDASGAKLQPLGAEETLAFGLEWSPDGRTIAFARWENFDMQILKTNPSALISSLWLIEAESGKERLLLPSEGQYAAWSLKWLPDGSGLVFLSNRGGDANLWFIRPDGTGLQQLTRQGGLQWADILGR